MASGTEERPAKRARLDNEARAQSLDDLLSNLGEGAFAEDWDEQNEAMGDAEVPAEADLFAGMDEDLFEADLFKLSSPPAVTAVYEEEGRPVTPDAMLDDLPPGSSPDPFYSKPEPLPTVIPTTVGFMTGKNQRPVPPPSKEAIERGLKLVASAEAEAEADPTLSSQDPAVFGLAPLAVSSAPLASSSALQALAPLESHDQPVSTSVPLPPAVAQNQAQGESGEMTPARRLNLGGRPALGGVKHNVSTPKQQTPGQLPSRFKPPGKATPGSTSLATPRRGLNLGMTPRRTLPANAKAFKTPFKRDADGTPIVKQVTAPAAAAEIEPVSFVKASKRKSAGTYSAVYDLTATSSRSSMRDYGLEPGRPIEDLLDHALPNELIFMTIEKAMQFSFEGQGGWKDALTLLRSRKATLATEGWTRNHWSLIIWKLAAIARAKPDEWKEWWSFQVTVNQLLYRYEREVNQAQRSAIKRIQEHDSSAAQAMVLCATRIKSIMNDEGCPVPMLELTDGWYRIDAMMDEPLIRACQKGKILIGGKIALVGAKISSSGKDGDDVLDAKQHSQLILCGNSTSLAPWDARLGFHRDKPAASLRSLNADGGFIACLEFQVIKLHPVAYMDVLKGSSSQDKQQAPRGEAEERARQAEWEKRYQEAVEKVNARRAKSGQSLEELADRLETAAESRTKSFEAIGSPEKDDFDAEDLLERLLENIDDRARVIKSLSKAQLCAAAKHAREQLMVGEQLDAQGQIEQLCPRRQSRSFRIVMITESHPVQGKSERTAQMTFWDCAAMPVDVLKPDGIYRGTNLAPSSKKAWSKAVNKGEIFLSSTRGSQFIQVA